MQTETIERTDTDERVDDGTDDDAPKFFHYVKKDKIAESAVMGTHVVALCGEVFPGDQVGQARLAGLPRLQADLRVAQDVAVGPGRRPRCDRSAGVAALRSGWPRPSHRP